MFDLDLMEVSDEHANKLEARRNWLHEDKFKNVTMCVCNEVTLKLEGSKPKKIGFYNTFGSLIKGYPNALQSSKHKFRRFNGYGVNYFAVQQMESIDKYVVFITDEGCYRITKEDILNSNIMCFSKKGYELQYIIPINKMKRINRKEIDTRVDL